MWFDVPKLGFPIELTTEGKAKIWIPKREQVLPSRLPVFYNPVMELNRDLAVLALQTFQRGAGREVDACEPLAGCGVRGVRFAAEVEGVKCVFLNDINIRAVALTRKNAKENGVEKFVSVENLDANLFLSQHAAPRQRFDYVDVDPFGSPVPYLDSAVRAVRNGGMIALTATDMAPLCGVHPRACVRKYGGKPLRTEYCHELAVRLLIGSLASTAARHDIGVRVLFCHSTDHYIRVYAVVGYGAQKADSSLKEMGHVLHCFNCFHRETIKGLFTLLTSECSECHGKLNIAGPLWLRRIFDKDFITNMQKELPKKRLKQERRINKLLFLTENEADAPATYYVIDKICDKYGLPAPSTENIIKRLERAGDTAIPTHFHKRGIKTNAPAKLMNEIMIKEAAPIRKV
ncbi:MAG TPA: tRNA (guanine(10)-N(2))-dimethyltransferase [Candidatus Krumholzibacteriaceae bacterium]|nr:tRNA (guanine(10)-N(2))-dimethyltransferase [Candidatus Krumholzibacteriaceae bacterium]